MIGLSVLVVLALSGVALVRDISLVDGGVGAGLLSMVIGLGEQANSMIFANNYIIENSPLWGMGLVQSFFGLAEPMVNEYSRSISPEYFAAGGGYGFFILADLVLNFGWAFSILAMFLFGYALMSVSRDRKGFFAVVLIAVVYANAFTLVRNDFGTTFRASAYTLVCVFLIKGFLKLISVFQRS